MRRQSQTLIYPDLNFTQIAMRVKRDVYMCTFGLGSNFLVGQGDAEN